MRDDDDFEERDSWGQDTHRHSVRHHDVAPKTVDDARRQYEQNLAASQKALQNSISIHTGKDGKQYFLGMRVPNGLAATLRYALTSATPFLNKEVAPRVYDLAFDVSKRLKFTQPHQSGLAAAGVFTSLLVGAKPATDLIHVYSEHGRERTDLFKELSPVLQAGNVSYRSNEVIQTALDQIHGNAIMGIKQFAADIPNIVLNSIFAVQDHTALVERKDKQFNVEARLQRSVDEILKEEMERVKVGASREIERQKQLKELQDGFIRENRTKRNPKTGQRYSEDELNKLWRDNEHKIRNRIDTEERELHKAKMSTDRHQDGHGNRESSFRSLIFATGALSEMIRATLTGEEQDTSKRTNAYEMIKHLKLSLEGQSNQRPSARGYGEDSDSDYGYGSTGNTSNVYIDGIAANKGKRFALKEFIAEIFQQNERDRGRTVIGPNLMTQLQPAIDQIADMLASGRLDTFALVSLVGGGKVVQHKGKSLRSFASPEQVEKLIDEQVIVLSSQERIKPEEFFSNFADPQLIQTTLKNNLSTLQGTPKLFFIALFPDDILVQAGMNKTDVLRARKMAHDLVYDAVAASVLDMAKKEPEQLKKLGLTDKEIETVKTLAERIEVGDEIAVKMAVDGKDKTAVAAIRTYGLNAQTTATDEGAAYWANRVKESVEARKKLRHAPINDDAPQDKRFAMHKKHTGYAESEDLEESLSDREAKRRNNRESPLTL